jgi:hypothetical protein
MDFPWKPVFNVFRLKWNCLCNQKVWAKIERLAPPGRRPTGAIKLGGQANIRTIRMNKRATPNQNLQTILNADGLTLSERGCAIVGSGDRRRDFCSGGAD